MDDAAHGPNSRPMNEYFYLYNSNAAYGSHEVHRFHQQRCSPQYSMISPSTRPSQHSPPFERYTDYDEEEEEKDSPAVSEGDWSTEEDERRDGMHKEAQFPARSTSRYYPHSMPQRPLINHVRNDWRTDPRYGQNSSSPPPNYDNFDCLQIICAKRIRRIVGLFLISSLAFWVAWFSYLSPKLNEHLLLKASLDHRQNSKSGWFGANVRPKFQDMIQLKMLDESLLPARSKHKDGKKRLIIIGDIHGCKDECATSPLPSFPFREISALTNPPRNTVTSLLSKLSFHAPTDHLILAGDLISKGPSSPAVVSLALSLNASCVRGNHEDRALLAHRDLHAHRLTHLPQPTPPTPPPPATYTPHPSHSTDTDADAFPHGDAIDSALAASFSEKEIAYLASCPVILHVGRLPSLGSVSVVHAGLVPGVKLEAQDPSAVMSMRSIDLDTHVPSRDAQGGVPWTKLWNKYQSLRPKGERSTVVYGHDSKRGLVRERWSRGLDTGCVRGGRLTALVIERGWWGGVREMVVSVGCRDYRVRRLEGLGEG